MMKKIFGTLKYRVLSAAICLLVISAFPASGQRITDETSLSYENSFSSESSLSFETSLSIDWTKAQLNSRVSYNLAQAGIRLPTGRFLADEILQEAFPGLIRSHILSLKVDSASSIIDMRQRGELSLQALDALCRDAEKTPPSLSTDLTSISGRYTILMDKISALLNWHRRAIEPAIPLFPVPTANYTGIIIIADTALPVHGRRDQANVEPCLFPKIWDTDMNLIYERNMFDSGRNGGNLIVRYTSRENILRPTPSGLDGDLAALLGNNPLRVLAREVFGINPTDPVIDRDDALKILSSENNRRLLHEGRIALVLNEKQLRLGN